MITLNTLGQACVQSAKPKKAKAEFIGPRLPRGLRKRQRELRQSRRRKHYPPRFQNAQETLAWWTETLTVMGYKISSSSVDESHAALKVNHLEFRITPKGSITGRPFKKSQKWEVIADDFHQLIMRLGSTDPTRFAHVERRNEVIKNTIFRNSPGWPLLFNSIPERRHGHVLAIGDLRSISGPDHRDRLQLEVVVQDKNQDKIVSTMVDSDGVVGDLRISLWASTFKEALSTVQKDQWPRILSLMDAGPASAVLPPEDRPYAAYIIVYTPHLIPALKTVLVSHLDTIEQSRAIVALTRGWRFYGGISGATCPGCLEQVKTPTHHDDCPKPVLFRRFEVYQVTLRVDVDADDDRALDLRLQERLKVICDGPIEAITLATKKVIS